MLKPQYLLPLADELVIDLFAGGGGASTGIEAAIGRHVDDQADKARMVGQLLGELGGARTTLRIATCESLPIVLVQWSAGKGWSEWVHPGDRA